MAKFKSDLFLLNRIFFLRRQFFLAFLLFAAVFLLGVHNAFAQAAAAPRLLNHIGLPVAVPGMDKWLGVAKPGENLKQEWRRLFAGKTKEQQIEEVNVWVNSQIEYRKDGSDRWLSPAQSLARGYGDCEDFAILKYYILESLGFREDQLYFLFTDDLVARTEHAVLLINAGGHEYVLDNFSDNVIAPSAALSVLNLKFAYSGKKSWVFGIKKSP